MARIQVLAAEEKKGTKDGRDGFVDCGTGARSDGCVDGRENLYHRAFVTPTEANPGHHPSSGRDRTRRRARRYYAACKQWGFHCRQFGRREEVFKDAQGGEKQSVSRAN